MVEEFDKLQIEQALHAAKIMFLKDEPLKKHTSFQVGGPAEFFCIPKDVQQLIETLSIARTAHIPYCLLGRGSNVIFKDKGYEGLVISFGEGEFSRVEQKGNGFVVGAAVHLAQLCTKAQAGGLSGLEFAYGIPGSVAGAVYMNAGAYGGELCDVLTCVHILDEQFNRKTLAVSNLGMAYRSSLFQRKPWVILSAEFTLQPKDSNEILARMQEIQKQRREKQPLDYPSAGSAFKRPQGAFAAALIEQCGLKGKQIGGAAVSEKHSGFIINVGNASCQDIEMLANEVAKEVQKQTGYQLEREFQLMEA